LNPASQSGRRRRRRGALFAIEAQKEEVEKEISLTKSDLKR
jgi:hypothetical protein